MNVRRSKISDIEELMKIYKYAREQMILNGNPNQWNDNYPVKRDIIYDIENGNSYVIEENNEICGTFAFIIGEEPTYKVIEGSWLNEKPYGTIHRVASNGKVKGILEKCTEYCEKQISNIKIDTHENNKIMKHLLNKLGYKVCGIVYVEDGTARTAYQKCIDML